MFQKTSFLMIRRGNGIEVHDEDKGINSKGKFYSFQVMSSSSLLDKTVFIKQNKKR
jgi:hypothetical protein